MGSEIRTLCAALTTQTQAGENRFGVLADKTTLKPLLSLQFVGVLLLRFAERQLLSLLFQQPPRTTRGEPGSAYPFTNTRSLSTDRRRPQVSACDTYSRFVGQL